MGWNSVEPSSTRCRTIEPLLASPFGDIYFMLSFKLYKQLLICYPFVYIHSKQRDPVVERVLRLLNLTGDQAAGVALLEKAAHGGPVLFGKVGQWCGSPLVGNVQ
jgi:hypothetical protein